MHLSAANVAGLVVGCASVAQVCSFALVAPLKAATSGASASAVAHAHEVASIRDAGFRRRRLALHMSASAEEDGWGAGGEGEDADMGDSSSQVPVATKKKKKKSNELDDIMSEVAGRADEEPVIVPRSAGVVPMAPGPIKADPIAGLDSDDVPGKIVLDPDTLAAQQKGLEKIAQQLRRERLDKEDIDAITFGFCPRAELWNGRSAMFGITVGMLTELWTGQSIPQQVETFAQVIGLLPLDYETLFP